MTLVPPVTTRSRLKLPSGAAVVEAVVVAEFESVFVAADVDVVARDRRAGHRDRRDETDDMSAGALSVRLVAPTGG